MEVDQGGGGDEGVTGGGAETERPTTPSMPISIISDKMSKSDDEWWRPSHPPETYKWEEVRRQRKKGGYPWTLLDNENEDEINASEYLDDNLYEPVNPPPLHESGSVVMRSKDKMETGSLDGFKIDIPPEIEIVNSEGLDGLDLPDPHDFGVDGDREWGHSDDEQTVPSKILFTAGIRGKGDPPNKDFPEGGHGSNLRPLINKTLTFDPATKEEGEEDEHHLDVGDGGRSSPRTRSRSQSRSRSRSPNPREGPPKKTTSAFDILKSKAVGAAGQVKQRFNKIALPVRPKLNQWEGVKMSKKKSSKKKGAAAAGTGLDQEVPQDMEQDLGAAAASPEFGHLGEAEPMEVTVTGPPEEEEEEEEKSQATTSSAKEAKEAAAEAARKEKEALAEEKKRKQKEQEELKKQKAEEKKREAEEKKREADELKRVKAEEKQRAKEEADRKKAEEKAAKAKIQEEAKKAKLEEQLAKARELEEQERQKNEELLTLREQEAAAGAVGIGGSSPQPPPQVQEGDSSSMLEDLQEQQEQEDGELGRASTPSGTGSRRKKIKKTFVQLPKLSDLPSLPKLDLDFKRKVIKRSKTPPARPTPPKMKQRRGVEETENQLATQYAAEIEARKVELEEEAAAQQQQLEQQLPGRSVQFPETPIFVTQPSTENSEETESAAGGRGWKSFPSTKNNEDYNVDVQDTDELIQQHGQQQQQQQQQGGTKEKLGNFGQQLKGFGMKSKEMASKKSKAMGATMKVIGKDLQKFGVKTSEKFQATIDEIKLKQEAAKARSKEMKAKEAEDIDQEMENVVPYPQESATEPRRKFRFRRRDDSQDEDQHQQQQQQQQMQQQQGSYEEEHHDDEQNKSPKVGGGDDGGRSGGDDKRTRSQLLGRAERDWESPLELARSRDASEEPQFSGNASSRDSPPGSSLASSTFAHVRKQGVLEEIDSDEFFLREKGISEGEDEEEINRFLVQELRQAFRLQENSLAGFDLPEAPQRPGRQARINKPARKQKEESEQQQLPQQSVQSYQTFPPERPRRKAPGYISDYIKEQGQEMEEEDQGSNREERGSYLEEDLEEFGEGMDSMKEEMKKIERQVNEEGNLPHQFVDDGRYEPVVGGVEPVKPVRRNKPKQLQGSTTAGAPLYYNTIGGENDWMREIEDQVLHHDDNINNSSLSAPKREEVERSKSRSLPPASDNDNDVTFVEPRRDESNISLPPQQESSSQQQDDDMEYVDEAGYAVVHKDREAPHTAPRKKKRGGGGSKGNSLKRQTDQSPQPSPSGGEAAAFFSLPRFTPRSLHIVPPSRPQRTYSTVRPRRPPRHRSNQNLSKGSKADKTTDPARPSTAIGIMQGRPLPAIPSPRGAGGANPLNNLDQSSIERAVGARHYTNFVSDGAGGLRGVEEVCVATNIPLLGGGSGGGDINIAIQTDPVQEFENEQGPGVVGSGSDRSGHKQSDTQNTTTGLRQDANNGGRAPSTGRDRDFQFPSGGAGGAGGGGGGSEFMFPRRLHLDELEVDVLRVHDLSAHSINVEHLRTSQMEVNSLTSIGPLTVSSIHTQTLNSDQINCNRLASDTVDLPTIVPPAFYNLATPSSDGKKGHDEKPEELRHFAREKEEAENDIICPYSPFEDGEAQYENMNDSLKTDDLSFERPSPGSPSDDFFMCGRSVEFCLTPEQSMDNDDSWNQDRIDGGSGSGGNKVATITEEDDRAQYSDLKQQDSAERSPNLSTLTTEEVENLSSDGNKQPGPAFRIAVLEEHDGSEEEEELGGNKSEELDLPPGFSQNEPPVLSGSLRLEYRRSPEVPSDFQVLHDIHVARGGQPGSIPPRSPPTPPPPPHISAKLLEKKSEERKSASTERSIATTRSSLSREPSEFNRADDEDEDEIISSGAVAVSTPILDTDQQQDLIQLSVRFGRAVSRIVMRGLQAIIDYVDIATTDDPTKAEEQKAHMQVLLCLLLILIAGIILSSSNAVVNFTPPKWEFLMPPPHL